MKRYIKKLGKLNNWQYLISGLTGSLGKINRCPGCNAVSNIKVDKKFFHVLHACQDCGLLFRHPKETKQQMDKFYQTEYSEPGLTTELPAQEELARLLKTEFAGSPKDFHYHINIFRALGIGDGAKILDFGANWGYTTYQLCKAGFDAQGFEPSRTRAEFGKNLGLEISTQIPQVEGAFDAVYSCHVLEHVPNPEQTIRDQLRLVRSGGMVLAHTPNGSLAARKADPEAFHLRWGKVHSVLLNDEFLKRGFGQLKHYIASDDNPEELRKWSQKKSKVGDVSGSGLFFVLVRP